jgi:hypothetical protein
LLNPDLLNPENDESRPDRRLFRHAAVSCSVGPSRVIRQIVVRERFEISTARRMETVFGRSAGSVAGSLPIARRKLS